MNKLIALGILIRNQVYVQSGFYLLLPTGTMDPNYYRDQMGTK